MFATREMVKQPVSLLKTDASPGYLLNALSSPILAHMETLIAVLAVQALNILFFAILLAWLPGALAASNLALRQQLGIYMPWNWS